MILGRLERAFILGSLSPHRLDVEQLRHLVARRLRWRPLLRTARETGLAPAVAAAAMAADVWDKAPDDVRAELHGALTQNTAQNSALLKLLAQVVEALRKERVPAWPLKGGAMLLRDPELIHIRSVSDLDLLVRPNDVVLATGILVRSGWKVQSRLTEIDVRGRELPRGAEVTDSPHGFTLRGPTGLHIELHHALPSADEMPRQVDAAFFTRAGKVKWGRHELDCPSLEDLLAVACEHVVIHHRHHLVHHPRLVIDIDALLAAGADPARAKALWGSDVAAAVNEGLATLEEARLGCRNPTVLGLGRAERALSRAWRWSKGLRLRLQTYGGLPAWFVRAVRQHGWRAIFPVRAFMVARFRVSSRSPVVPLLYVWRPIRKIITLLTNR